MTVLCSAKEFYSLYQDLLRKTKSFYMEVKGGSMYPFIRSGDLI
ncbi:MAG: S24 family peptidase, partial [Nitrospirota bacterium]